MPAVLQPTETFNPISTSTKHQTLVVYCPLSRGTRIQTGACLLYTFTDRVALFEAEGENSIRERFSPTTPPPPAKLESTAPSTTLLHFSTVSIELNIHTQTTFVRGNAYPHLPPPTLLFWRLHRRFPQTKHHTTSPPQIHHRTPHNQSQCRETCDRRLP